MTDNKATTVVHRKLAIFGNNAACSCPACDQVYLARALDKNPRPCPECGLSTLLIWEEHGETRARVTSEGVKAVS